MDHNCKSPRTARTQINYFLSQKATQTEAPDKWCFPRQPSVMTKTRCPGSQPRDSEMERIDARLAEKTEDFWRDASFRRHVLSAVHSHPTIVSMICKVSTAALQFWLTSCLSVCCNHRLPMKGADLMAFNLNDAFITGRKLENSVDKVAQVHDNGLCYWIVRNTSPEDMARQ